MVESRPSRYTVRDHGLSEVSRRGKGEPLRVRVLSPEAAPGKRPVIIFSHGLGGRPRRLLGWAQQWASLGFICFLPRHRDGVGPLSRERALGHEKSSPESFGRPAIRQALASDGAAFESRVRAVRDLMDALEDGLGADCDWGAAETRAIGLAGHSIGAYAAQILAGTRVQWGNDSALASHRDKRVRAVLLFSPQGAGRLGLCSDSWTDLTCPMMSVTGAEDRGAGGEAADWRRQPFELAGSSFKYQVTLPAADHFAILGRHAAGGRVNPGHETLLQGLTGLFWQAHLLGDIAAKTALETGRFQAESGGAGLNFEVGHEQGPLSSQ